MTSLLLIAFIGAKHFKSVRTVIIFNDGSNIVYLVWDGIIILFRHWSLALFEWFAPIGFKRSTLSMLRCVRTFLAWVQLFCYEFYPKCVFPYAFGTIMLILRWARQFTLTVHWESKQLKITTQVDCDMIIWNGQATLSPTESCPQLSPWTNLRFQFWFLERQPVGSTLSLQNASVFEAEWPNQVWANGQTKLCWNSVIIAWYNIHNHHMKFPEMARKLKGNSGRKKV